MTVLWGKSGAELGGRVCVWVCLECVCVWMCVCVWSVPVSIVAWEYEKDGALTHRPI